MPEGKIPHGNTDSKCIMITWQKSQNWSKNPQLQWDVLIYISYQEVENMLVHKLFETVNKTFIWNIYRRVWPKKMNTFKSHANIIENVLRSYVQLWVIRNIHNLPDRRKVPILTWKDWVRAVTAQCSRGTTPTWFFWTAPL